MYFEHFGLHESPFALTPDPRYLYMSDAHKEALASMVYGVQERKGFVLILGEVGTGKTTLIRHLLGHFGDNIRTVYIFNSLVSFEDLLRAILRDLELPCPSRQRLDMIETLNDYLIRETTAGRYVVLIVDEAQHLSPEVLEDLRMLSNLETSTSKLLQIILVGQPELGQKLARPGLRQLRQRIGLVAELNPLTYDETVKYITHRLEVAGHRGRALFTRLALRKIHKASGGIPRLVNVLCDKSLVLAFGDGASQVGRRTVKQVVQDWSAYTRPHTPAPIAGQRRAAGVERRARPPRRLARVAAAVLVPLIAVPALLVAVQRLDLVGRFERLLSRQEAGAVGVDRAGAAGPENAPAAAPRAPRTPPPATTVSLPPRAEAPAPQPPAATPLTQPAASPATAAAAGSGAASVLPPAALKADAVKKTALLPPGAPLVPSIGEVTVRPGDTLGALVFSAYGRADFTLIDHVRMANPAITDVNLIEVGRRLRFPPLEPSRMIHRQGESHYVLHLATVALTGTRTLDRLRAATAAEGRKVYVIPVRFTGSFEVYRVLVGDFEDRTEAEKFSRAFHMPSGLSNSQWG